MTRTSKRALRPGFDDLEGRQLLSTLPGTSPSAPAVTINVVNSLTTIQTQSPQVHSYRETWVVNGKDLVHLTVWTYFLEIDWTSNGRRITSASSHAYGVADTPLWSYAGVLTHWSQGGVGSNYFRVFSEGHFQLHLPKIGPIGGGVIQNSYPIIDETVHA